MATWVLRLVVLWSVQGEGLVSFKKLVVWV